MEQLLKILHLEDEENDVELAQIELATEGIVYETVIAENREQFVAALEAGGFDLILSDFALPSFDGMKALALTRERYPDIPFIFLSGQMGEERAIESLKKGATDYVLKTRISRLGPAVLRALQEHKERLSHLHAEKILHESEERYRSLFNNSIDAILLTEPDGKILAANPEACRIFGRTEEELCRCGRESVVDPEDPKVKVALEVRSHVGQFKGELQFFRKDGSAFPGEISSIIYKDRDGNDKASIIIRDITVRRETEEALQKFAQVVEQSPNCVVITDTTGAIEYVNPKFSELTGYTSSEAAGQNPRILKSGETPSITYKTMWETITKGDIWQGVLHNRKKNGDLYWESAAISPLKGKDGVITKFFAIKEDITERKKLEEQLLQSQKMEVIGQLSGGIAHDLNNILTAIIGFSSLIEMGMSDDDPKRDNLNHVISASNRAAELTKSLLAFSRKQIINPQPIDFNKIISKAKKFMSCIISENIEFKVSFKREVLMVNADSGQIEQVLMNLMTNARDAMPGGGLLTIETDVIDLDTNFINAHGFGEPGVYVQMIFSDSGKGMDSETCKKVFEPFFTTKEVGKGTGLGLSIVYGIIKQHKGFINVYSEPGNGTIFRIYLPLIRSVTEKAIQANEVVLQGGNETILVTDDDYGVRELLKRVLSQFGYTVITATDGYDAVTKFKANHTRINLVLLDIIMPKMNGKEVCEEMKKIEPSVKTIFMSGYTRDIIHTQGVLDENLEFLPKPLNPQQLLIKVRSVLDGVLHG